MTSKIDIGSIISSHLATLHNYGKKNIRVGDLLVFYVFPALIGVAVWWFGLKCSTQIYNISISVFGIFAGLMLNVQVGVFNIFIRTWSDSEDPSKNVSLKSQNAARNSLLGELNTNISYLTLIATFGILLSLLFYALENHNSSIFTAILSVVYVHFLLTFLMVTKRAHLLFSQEYSRT